MDELNDIERKLGASIKQRLNIFGKVLHEYDAYYANNFLKEKDMKINQNILDNLDEILSSETFRKNLYNNAIENKVKIKQLKTTIVKNPEDYHRHQIEYKNLGNLDCFNQSSFIISKRYFSYANEKVIMKNSIFIKLVKNIKRTIFVKMLIVSKKNEPLKHNVTTSNTSIVNTEQSVKQSYVQLTSTSANSNPLYTIPIVRKDILNDEFVLRSIKKFNFNGELLMDVKLENIMKKLNIKEKKFVKLYDLNLEKVKEMDIMIQDNCIKRALLMKPKKENEEPKNISWNNVIKSNIHFRNYVIDGVVDKRNLNNQFRFNNSVDRVIVYNSLSTSKTKVSKGTQSLFRIKK